MKSSRPHFTGSSFFLDSHHRFQRILFSKMNDRIKQRLADLEAEHGFQILYACESGSRAWEFASADSDYDVRFIHAWPIEKYVGPFEPKDQMTRPVDEFELDFSGWDLRKALGLFRKSNGSLMEWLYSPIVYRENTEVMNRWRDLVSDSVVANNSAAHYLGLRRQMWLEMRDGKAPVTAKRYLYVLRSLLVGRFVIENEKPIPVLFESLRNALDLPAKVSFEIDHMITAKSEGKESDSIEGVAVLENFIESERLRLDELLPNVSGEIGDAEPLNQFFHEVTGFTS